MRAPEVFISVRVNPSKSMDPRSNDVPDQLGCHPGRLASASRSGTQVSRHCRLTLAIVQFTQGVLGPGSRAARSAGMTAERIVLIIRPAHQRSAEEAARLEAGEVAGVVEGEAALGPVDANAGLETLPTGCRAVMPARQGGHDGRRATRQRAQRQRQRILRRRQIGWTCCVNFGRHPWMRRANVRRCGRECDQRQHDAEPECLHAETYLSVLRYAITSSMSPSLPRPPNGMRLPFTLVCGSAM